jgi:hypothetical protein
MRKYITIPLDKTGWVTGDLLYSTVNKTFSIATHDSTIHNLDNRIAVQLLEISEDSIQKGDFVFPIVKNIQSGNIVDRVSHIRTDYAWPDYVVTKKQRKDYMNAITPGFHPNNLRKVVYAYPFINGLSFFLNDELTELLNSNALEGSYFFDDDFSLEDTVVAPLIKNYVVNRGLKYVSDVNYNHRGNITNVRFSEIKPKLFNKKEADDVAIFCNRYRCSGAREYVVIPALDLSTEPAYDDIDLDPNFKLDALLHLITTIRAIRHSAIKDLSFKILPAEFSSDDMLKIIDELKNANIKHTINKTTAGYYIEVNC